MGLVFVLRLHDAMPRQPPGCALALGPRWVVAVPWERHTQAVDARAANTSQDEGGQVGPHLLSTSRQLPEHGLEWRKLLLLSPPVFVQLFHGLLPPNVLEEPTSVHPLRLPPSRGQQGVPRALPHDVDPPRHGIGGCLPRRLQRMDTLQVQADLAWAAPGTGNLTCISLLARRFSSMASLPVARGPSISSTYSSASLRDRRRSCTV